MNFTAQDVAAHLGGHRNGGDWIAPCPCHEDRTPSLSIREEAGKVLVRCHAGCSQQDVWPAVVRAMNGSPGKGSTARAPFGEPVASYQYHDAGGRLLFEVQRDAEKHFRQRRPSPTPGESPWIYSLHGVPRPLYRLPQVLFAVAMQKAGKFPEPVFVVEGERDADSLEALGLIATTNPCGAGKWRPEHTESLRGAKSIVVVPDNDEPGRRHSETVMHALHPVVREVRILELPELADKGDVTDWIAAGGTKAEMLRLARTAPTTMRSGLLRPISGFESREVSWLWPGRIPLGMLSLVEGDPGVGKSTMLLDIAARASRGDPMPEESTGIGTVNVVLLSAEDPVEEVIRPRLEAAGADLDRVHIFSIQEPTEADTRPPTLCPDDLKLLEEKIQESGAKLLAVDPVVAYMPDATDTNSDHSVRRVLRLLSGIAERTGCAVVAIRHWRKAESGNALYRGGGSIGFAGAARSVLTVGSDPDDSEKRRKVLAVAKSNVAAIGPSLLFSLAVENGDKVPGIRWGGISRHTASDLTQAQTGNAGRDAEDFLRDRVTEAGVPSRLLLDEAKETDISPITLRRAKKRLGIEVVKASDGRSWLWKLPRQGDHQGVDDHGGPSLISDHLRGNDDHLPMTDLGGACVSSEVDS